MLLSRPRVTGIEPLSCAYYHDSAFILDRPTTDHKLCILGMGMNGTDRPILIFGTCSF